MVKRCPCGNQFETKTKQQYCSEKCKIHFKNLEQYPDGSGYVECKLCGFRAYDLHSHLKKVHKIDPVQYCQTFNLKLVELQSLKLRQHNSDMQKLAYKEGRLKGWGKGENNPSNSAYVKSGQRSIFSMNYRGYVGMTDDEKRQTIENVCKKLAQEKAKKNNNPLTIAYYVKRGFSEEDAKLMLKKRQSTFSLKRCIAEYGEEEGQKIFSERQAKWQSTMKSKPFDEQERIAKAKMFNGLGYSKISQDLFNEIVKRLEPNEFKEIYFATNDPTKQFNELMVIDDLTSQRYFLDFCIKDNKHVIEFDGDYWHDSSRIDQAYVNKRNETLARLGFKVMHVLEHDFKDNPRQVIDKCLKFLRESTI